MQSLTEEFKLNKFDDQTKVLILDYVINLMLFLNYIAKSIVLIRKKHFNLL